MPAEEKDRVEVDDARSELTIPHWGITMRTLFGAAVAGWANPQPGQVRQFTVRHKDAHIATINVRQHNDITN